MVFAEPGCYPSQAFQHKFWDFLGVTPALAKVLVEDVKLWWDPHSQKLWVTKTPPRERQLA